MLVRHQDLLVGDQHILVARPDWCTRGIVGGLMPPDLSAHHHHADILAGVLELVVAVVGAEDELDGHAVFAAPRDAVVAVARGGGVEEVQAAGGALGVLERGGRVGAEGLAQHDAQQEVHQPVVLLPAQLPAEVQAQVGGVDPELAQELLDAGGGVERHQLPRAHGLCASREGGAPFVGVSSKEEENEVKEN